MLRHNDKAKNLNLSGSLFKSVPYIEHVPIVNHFSSYCSIKELKTRSYRLISWFNFVASLISNIITCPAAPKDKLPRGVIDLGVPGKLMCRPEIHTLR